MSGTEEVEVVVRIVSDGIRAKMLRPKCLARPSWLLDSDHAVLKRLYEETDELTLACGAFYRNLARFGPTDPLTVEARAAVFAETCDVSAFGAFLIDPRRRVRFGEVL